MWAILLVLVRNVVWCPDVLVAEVGAVFDRSAAEAG